MSDKSEIRSMFHSRRTAGEEVRSRMLNKLFLKIKEDEPATAMDVDIHDEGDISAEDQLADADFFNAFQDDFDDSDIFK